MLCHQWSGVLLLTEQSHYGHGKGQGVDQRGYPMYPGVPKPEDQMESQESEEEGNEDNSFIGKIKSFFGRGKKKDDDTNRIVGLGPSFELLTVGTD